MTISWLQAIILGIFACLSSMPGMGGTTIGNYTLGRPLVAGLVCGIVLGDIQAGVLVGAATVSYTHLPDGPKVGSVAVSPRGDLRMPSDASPTAWL